MVGGFPSHGRLMKALQHLTQGLARHHRLFGPRSAGAAPRTFHGAPGSHRTWQNAVKLCETGFFCLKMKRTPADLMSLSDDLLDWSRAFHFFNHPIHWSLFFILFLHHYIYPQGQHEPRSSAKLLLARPGATRGPLTICLPGKWYICIDDHQTNRDTNRLWEMNGDTSMTQSTLDTSWYIYDLWTLNLLSWIQIIGVRHKSDPKFMTLRETSVDSPFIRMGAMPGSTLTCLAKNT